MSGTNNEVNENVVQAIVIADTFGDEFLPISNDIPLALLPLINKPIIDYTLEFLSLGGIEETFLFCCTHVEAIKDHISKSVKNNEVWTLSMKVNIIVSESCHSFGDCLRDIDAKGLLRGNFVLLEPGTVSNIELLPLLKKHEELTKTDKGAAMTVVYQEGGKRISRSCQEDVVLIFNDEGRILFYKKMWRYSEKKVKFPMEIFLENDCVSLRSSLKDTHIAICSPSVLPLFSDNFDFQTKDDFIRGLIMNEEILGSSVYCHVLNGSQHGGGILSWRMYQALSQELNKNWMYPIVPSRKRNRWLRNNVTVGEGTNLDISAKLCNTVLGENVSVGKNVQIEDAFVFANCNIEDDVIITHSVIGPNCVIKSGSKITAGTILGVGCVIEKDSFIENSLIQSTKPNCCNDSDQLGEKAYRLPIDCDDDEEDSATVLARKMSRLYTNEEENQSEISYGSSDSDVEELSHTQSPAPDDTKLFYTEVIDSLTRGFEDNLLCDNLILEINSSRYAYNVTVKEVNFYVIKAILTISLLQPIGPQYFSHLSRLLAYFAPVLKNYIRNESAMLDCLKAIEDVATSNEDLKEKWVMFVMKYFYDKDYLSEDAILDFVKTLDEESKFYKQVKPFTDWLEEAEEASSTESD